MNLEQENDMLRAEHIAMRQELARMVAAQKKPARSFLGLILNIGFWLLVSVLAIVVIGMMGPDLLVGYGVVSPEKMSSYLHLATPAPTGTKQQPTAPPYQRPQGGSGSSSAPLSAPLPDCATVEDTRTACQQQPQPTEAPPPEATAEPAYVSACQTEPGARPCWLPAEQPWQPPASVPETPVVLVPEATEVPLVFVEAACQSWHPPQVYPEGCP